MTLTAPQARARLLEARRQMEMARKLANGRASFDPQAGVTLALLEVISFLEDALA